MIENRIQKLGFEKKRRSMGGYPEGAEAVDEEDSVFNDGSTTACSFSDEGSVNEDDGKVPVFVLVRCRPASVSRSPLITFAVEEVKGKRMSLRVDPGSLAGSGVGGGSASARSGARSFRCNSFLATSSSQADVFEQAAPMVEHVMNGYNSTIFCYGVTGSGKTFTMSGPPGRHNGLDSDEAGIAQRVSKRLFEVIRDGATRGQTFSVEASFLEIYSSDGKREQLIDLLNKKDDKLEVKRDPINPDSFSCEGLTSCPIRSPDELCELLHRGRQRCNFMETTKNFQSSRSHCLFSLTVESIIEATDGGEPDVKRGKLMLVDLAGSESIKKVQAASEENEALRRQQAIGINRVLSSLGTVVNNMNNGMSGAGHRDSLLTMLLHDCLGGNSRALLVANIAPEKDNGAEVMKTLAFAQQMTCVKNTATVNHIKTEQSSIVKLRQRHAEALRILEAQPSQEGMEEKEKAAREKLRAEVEEMGQRMITSQSAQKTLEDMQAEHLRKVQELKEEMAASVQNVSKEVAETLAANARDMQELRTSLAQQFEGMGSASLQQVRDDHEAQLSKVRSAHDETRQAHRELEVESNALRVKLASAEERAQMLQSRMDELQQERGEIHTDRKSLQQQTAEQWQRVATAEGEAQRFKAECSNQAAELERLKANKREDEEAAKREREESRKREEELRRENAELRQQIADAKRDREIEVLRSEAVHREATTKLQMQVERLEIEGAAKKEQIAQLQGIKAGLEGDLAHAKKMQDQEIYRFTRELEQAHEDLEEANQEKTELLHMLDEMQNTVIQRQRQG